MFLRAIQLYKRFVKHVVIAESKLAFTLDLFFRVVTIRLLCWSLEHEHLPAPRASCPHERYLALRCVERG